MPSLTPYSKLDDIHQLLDGSASILIMQADNPDADSLGSSLALEHILGDRGKHVSLYCGTPMPSYLHYLKGWDRVSSELPKNFDVSIIVDASTLTLFDKLLHSGEKGWVAAKPCIIIDHHATVQNLIDFATVTLLDSEASSASEVVYNLAVQSNWRISAEAGACLMTGILADTQGLSNDLASATTYRAMAALVDLGVNRPLLEEQRREYNRMPEQIFRYKAKLIERTEFLADSRIATVTIPQPELYIYSPLYNPIPLIQNDMLTTSGVCMSVVFKHYEDGRVTGSIRANFGHAVADKLAEHMGGGGNPYASGFRIESGRPFNEIKSECIDYASQLLNSLNKDTTDETLRYTLPEN
jgi:phosphoesterase RecJ-like protein